MGSRGEGESRDEVGSRAQDKGEHKDESGAEVEGVGSVHNCGRGAALASRK